MAASHLFMSIEASLERLLIRQRDNEPFYKVRGIAKIVDSRHGGAGVLSCQRSYTGDNIAIYIGD